MEKFQGQWRSERILYFSREVVLSFFLVNFFKLFTFLVLFFILIIIMFFFEVWMIYYFLLTILWFFFIFIYLYVFWYNTYLIVTNKRIIKFVNEWLFVFHFKELKIDNLQEKVCKVWWIFWKIMNYWNVNFIWKDQQTVIRFRWVKSPKEVVLYVSRLRDYIIENPNYRIDDLNKFIPRKLRYKREQNIK